MIEEFEDPVGQFIRHHLVGKTIADVSVDSEGTFIVLSDGLLVEFHGVFNFTVG